MVQLNYYLGPWAWEADPVDPYWRAPTGCVGCVDLASLPQLSVAPGAPRNVGFFACASILPSEYALLGQGDCRDLKADAALAARWQSMTGYSPNVSGTLADTLADHLMHGCDPLGLNACLPLVPTAERIVEIHLGGHSVIWQRRFAWDTGVHTNRVKALLQAMLLAIRADAHVGRLGLHAPDPEFHRRVMQAMLEKYQIPFDELRPGSWPRNETPLPHQTTISDDFNRADNPSSLGSAAAGWSWTNIESTFKLVSNQATNSGVSVVVMARADSDLSTNDNFSQADIIARDATTSGLGSCCRKDGTATATYYFGRLNSGNATLSKRVAGSSTQLGSSVGVTVSLPQAIKTYASGSTISVDYAGVNKIALTDSSIATGLRTGLEAVGGSAGNCQLDNFSAGDLAATGILFTQLERSPLGILRGVYTHY